MGKIESREFEVTTLQDRLESLTKEIKMWECYQIKGNKKPPRGGSVSLKSGAYEKQFLNMKSILSMKSNQ